MRVALAQTNPIIGDLAGNRRAVEAAAQKAQAAGAVCVVFPELTLTGYPPMDLLDREDFVQEQLRELDALLPLSQRIPLVLGAVLPAEHTERAKLVNAAVVLVGGRRSVVQPKTLLPTYDVFDENRYFVPAERRKVFILPGTQIIAGLTVCEDAWAEELAYSANPVAELARQGARLIFNLSASPWHVGKALERRHMLAALARHHGVSIVFVNQVGGNDELIFDGGSAVIDAAGRVRAALPLFEPCVEVVDLETPGMNVDPEDVVELSEIEQLETGLVLGIRDYFRKQKLPPGAVIGLSGGVDSALTTHLAVLALGAERVLGVAMPGPFSSEHSVADAQALARNLGIELRCVDIRPVYDAYRKLFEQLFGFQDDYEVTQQNIQSRIRGALLMAISNREGRLVLATGNKSELSIGYCTLYGDTVGGIAVLGDVYKEEVYALARYANRGGERIPQRSLGKPPSAELAPHQLDTDDLPPYPVLDVILKQLIEGGLSPDAVRLPSGATAKTVCEIAVRLDRNEYKRRQAPLVLRTSRKAFGRGRRLPIVHRFKTE